MPFSPGDAKRHKKDIPPGAETTWSAIANSVLQSTGDESKAIRIANASVSPRPQGRKQ